MDLSLILENNELDLEEEEEVPLPVPLRERSLLGVQKFEKLKEEIELLKAEHLMNFAIFKTQQLAAIVPAACSNCPLQNNCKDRTKLKLCKKERELFNTALYGYMAELDITPDFPTEIEAAATLAVLDILESRCLEGISQEGMLIDTVAALDSNDNPIHEKAQHPHLKTLELLWRRRAEVKK